MMKVFTRTNLLFYLLVLPCSFVCGILYANFIGAAEGQGLAGGAIILGYGVLFAGSALLLAIVLSFQLQQMTIARINRALLVPTLLLLGFITYRVITIERTTHSIPNQSLPKQPTTPAADLTESADSGVL